MKTKILVCSNSGINYVPHNLNIAAIPVILRFSEEEQYEDYIDVNVEAFYNRMRMDTHAKVSLSFQTHAKINEYILQAADEGYGQVLFILASKEFSDLFIPVSIAISENKEIPATIFNSNSCCYPLAYMAIEADRMLSKGARMEEVINRLEHIQKNHHIYFFNPHSLKEDASSFKKLYKKGLVYSIENGKLFPVLDQKGVTSFDHLINLLNYEIIDNDIILFIHYTNKMTKYIRLLEEALIKILSTYKKIRVCPLPIGVGIQTGINAIGVGYIVKS